MCYAENLSVEDLNSKNESGVRAEIVNPSLRASLAIQAQYSRKKYLLKTIKIFGSRAAYVTQKWSETLKKPNEDWVKVLTFL